MESSVKEALAELGMDTTIEHVTDFSKIAEALGNKFASDKYEFFGRY